MKRLVESIIQIKDPDVNIEGLRKMDFSYVFTLSKKGKTKEVELVRTEIEASWELRKGNVDETLRKKIKDTISELISFGFTRLNLPIHLLGGQIFRPDPPC